jgi:hypothetical protein
MPTIQNQRAQVLAEAVVSAYINELATPRERPAPRPQYQRPVVHAARRGRAHPRPRPVLARA